MARDREQDRRQQREEIVIDASRHLANDVSGNKLHLKIPEGLPLWQPRKVGVYVIDIVPYKLTDSSKRFVLPSGYNPGEWHYTRTYFNHSNIGINKASVTCIQSTFGKPCPVCAFRETKWNSPRKEDQDLADALKPKKRDLYLVFDHAERHRGLQLWDVSNWCFGQHLTSKISNASPKRKPLYLAFASPKDGFSLRLVASNKPSGGGGTYLDFLVDEFQEREEEMDPDLPFHGFVLDDCVRFPSADEVKKVFHGVEEPPTSSEEPPGDEDAVDAPAPRRNRLADEEEERPAWRSRQTEPEDDPPPARRRTPEPEDDDPPPRRRQAAAEEPDPEPAPKRRTPAAAEEPATSTDWQKGQEVTFEYREKQYTGVITKVDKVKTMASVQVAGEDKLRAVDFEDLKLAKPSRSKAPEPAEDDDPPPRRTARQPAEPEEEAPAPRRRPAASDPDDDPPPARRRPAAAEPAEKPKTARVSDWDDEDGGSFKKDEEEPAPRRRPAAAEDDDPPPRRTARQADPDDDPPAPRRTRK